MGGIEPPIVSLTGSRLTIWPHRIKSVRTAGFEPAASCSRGRRITRLSHVLFLVVAHRTMVKTPAEVSHLAGLRSVSMKERPAGVEPARPPWQGDRLPLHHGRLSLAPNCQRSPEHREGLEPSSPHDHPPGGARCGVFAARRPVPVVAVGPEGIEPTPAGLKVRCAASYTTTP